MYGQLADGVHGSVGGWLQDTLDSRFIMDILGDVRDTPRQVCPVKPVGKSYQLFIR